MGCKLPRGREQEHSTRAGAKAEGRGHGGVKHILACNMFNKILIVFGGYTEIWFGDLCKIITFFFIKY